MYKNIKNGKIYLFYRFGFHFDYIIICIIFCFVNKLN